MSSFSIPLVPPYWTVPLGIACRNDTSYYQLDMRDGKGSGTDIYNCQPALYVRYLSQIRSLISFSKMTTYCHEGDHSSILHAPRKNPETSSL